MDEKEAKEVKDALMDLELFKPDDVFYERVHSALYLMLQPVTGDNQIKELLNWYIRQYLVDAKLIAKDKTPRG